MKNNYDVDYNNVKFHKHDPNMVVNISPSNKIRESWDWVIKHNLEFDFLTEGKLVEKEFHERIAEMINPANYGSSSLTMSAYPDHDLDFLFYNEEDLMAFKLRWL